MSMERHTYGATVPSDLNENETWINSTHTTHYNDLDNPDSLCGFECNICLDLPQDPIVTFCGHLYCWPCIYRWIRNANRQKPQCPVCKMEVSESTIIPLYGRGQSPATTSAYDEHSDLVPQRPRCIGDTDFVPSPAQSTPRVYNEGVGLGGRAMVDPMIGMFGEMIYGGIFGNSGTSLYAYPNSYRLAGYGSPRTRRQMTQADKSLGRVCFFLCCCAIVCLFLF